MYQYRATCNCGNVTVEFSCPQNISRYASRKCDCDYCVQRGIEYLSDPKGQVTFISKSPLQHEKQGSEQATFLLCATCQVVVGVCYIDTDVSIGSINITIFEQFKALQESVIVSPKRLEKVEKVQRWRDVWSPLRFSKI